MLEFDAKSLYGMMGAVAQMKESMKNDQTSALHMSTIESLLNMQLGYLDHLITKAQVEMDENSLA